MVRTLTFTVIFLSSLGLSFAQSALPAFDFMIERNSDMVTIPQGSGGINALHVTLLSGSPQDVALSASGLPSGVTVSFRIIRSGSIGRGDIRHMGPPTQCTSIRVHRPHQEPRR